MTPFLAIIMFVTLSVEDPVGGIIHSLRARDIDQAIQLLDDIPEELAEQDIQRLTETMQQLSPQGEWLPLLEQLSKKAENHPEFLFFMAQASWRAGSLESALQLSEDAMNAAPNDADMLYRCAAIARTAKNLDEAERRIKKVLSLDADHPDALFLKADILSTKGNMDEARNLLQRVLKKHPKHIRSLFELGKLETKANQPEKALDAFNKAIKVYPFFREVYAAMRTPLARLKKTDELKMVQTILESTQHWNPNYYSQLRQLYEDAMQLSANDAVVLVNELMTVQQMGMAKDYLEARNRQNALNDTMRMYLAQMKFNEDEFHESLSLLTQIQEETTKDHDTYWGLMGWSLLRLGEHDKAQLLYNDKKDVYPDSNHLKALGETLAQISRDEEKQLKNQTEADDSKIQFKDVTEQTGLNIFHHTLGHADKRWIVDAMGSGVAVADYDNDGDDDIYFVNGRPKLDEPDLQWTNALFSNDAGEFVDVTKEAGVGDLGYGMCAVFGDVNNDGFQDLFVGNLGKNTFYLNNGDGTFTDQTEESGLAHDGYAAAAVFGDVDRDGDLDLFVGNYVEFDPIQHKEMRDNYHGVPVMKGPMGFAYQDDLLYINDGNGIFTEQAKKAGILISEGRAMGAAFLDLENDGDLDLYVANDSSYNHVLQNKGDATFEDVSFISGAAVCESGRDGASMGVAVGDINNDMMLDILVTSYEQESDVLFINQGEGMFQDASGMYGLPAFSQWLTTWGTGFCDFDADGKLDYYTVNGHVYPQVEDLKLDRSYPQGVSIYKNIGTQMDDVSKNALPESIKTISGRGSALIDYDQDGDMDIVINCIDSAPRLLENKSQKGNWLLVKLKASDARTFGTRVVVKKDDQYWTQMVDGGSSYLSQNSSLLHFGVGEFESVDTITIYWPHLDPQIIEYPPLNQHLIINEENSLEINPG